MVEEQFEFGIGSLLAGGICVFALAIAVIAIAVLATVRRKS